jgi:hypothetical protein
MIAFLLPIAVLSANRKDSKYKLFVLEKHCWVTSKSGQKEKKTHQILGKSSLPLTTQHDKFFLLEIRAKRQLVSESVCQISTINNSKIIIVHAAPLTLVQVTNERRVHSSP